MDMPLHQLALPLVWNSRREPWQGEELTPTRLARAMDAYAPQAARERALLLWDSTLTGRGKAGFLITDRALYLCYIDPVRLDFSQVLQVRASTQLAAGADIITERGVESTLYLGEFMHLPLIYDSLRARILAGDS